MTEVEHLDVLVIGAGISGIAAAHDLQAKTPWVDYAIFEGREAMGGTWDLFRYPGIRSDSDMFTLGYSFRPWDGEKTIADGESIRNYVKQTAEAEGIDRHIRFGRKVVRAEWSTEDARWTITAERVATGETFQLTCGFIFSCTGYYRYDRGHQPDFRGMEDFSGELVHPQHWPEDLDYAGKKVVVIGSGATAVTLVPAMAETAEHVTMLQRSPSYIASVPSKNPLTALGRRGGSSRFARSVVRWALAVLGVVSYRFSRKHPDTIRKFIRKGQEKALPAGYDIDTHFTPTYQPWDQRMCMVPDGDLFEAINDGRASVVTDHIDTFTSSGIRLESGTELDADIIVSATGLSMLFLGGIELVVDGEKVDPGKRLTYKGMMLQDVPNLAFAIGYTNASWTLKCELTSDYVARLLTRLHETGMRQCTPTGPMDGAEPQPLLPLSSGYVQRAVDAFPKQGEAFPWQVHQNYLKDYRAMRLSNVDDDVMSFSNPIPIRTRDTAPAPEPAVAGADR